LHNEQVRMRAENVDFYYGEKKTLYQITLPIYKNKVTSIIGPSGCGKSTFIRLLNRMNELIPNTRLEEYL